MTNTKAKKKGRGRPIVYDMTANQCVWAKAGVIGPTLCINAFNCLDCPLDRRMQGEIGKSALGKAPVSMNHLPAGEKPVTPYTQRKCRHMLSGRTPVKYCIHDYDCATCAYNQMIEEENLSLTGQAVKRDYAGGFAVARGYYYHRGHAWARIEYGGRVRVGLDDFAVRLLGHLDAFKLPELGSTVRQGTPEVGLARGELKAEALSPIEGVVVARNPKTLEKAQLANEDPYDRGWLMVIEPRKLKVNLKNLLFEDESAAWMEEESSRLSSIVSADTGYELAATGGRAIDDIYGQVPQLGWDRLVKAFLLTG